MNMECAPREGTMTLAALCEKIDLPADVRAPVLEFAASFDFSAVDRQLKDFHRYERMREARAQLQELLGPDEGHVKILACMLKGSADAYAFYRERGIDDQIYFDTMRCYTRFLEECRRSTGRPDFDRSWWTPRQAGCHLFRIGQLEYEIMPAKDQTVVELHIPSDADFSPGQVDRSLEMAEAFLQKYYPHLVSAEYCCHSWLLDGQLKEMLAENSNIRNFQTRFEILDRGGVDTEFIEWLFQTKSADISALPEHTSLQRNMKRYLLSGGQIHTALGRLIR